MSQVHVNLKNQWCQNKWLEPNVQSFWNHEPVSPCPPLVPVDASPNIESKTHHTQNLKWEADKCCVKYPSEVVPILKNSVMFWSKILVVFRKILIPFFLISSSSSPIVYSSFWKFSLVFSQ
jgi:hypothetical protein